MEPPPGYQLMICVQERVESLEKEGRMRLLQRSLGHTHSRDSAIDTDLQVIPITGTYPPPPEQLAFYCVLIACSLEFIRPGLVQDCKAPMVWGRPYFITSSESGLVPLNMVSNCLQGDLNS